MIAEVIVGISNDSVDKIFDYIANPETVVGQRVEAPFGNRTIEGYVLRLKETSKLNSKLLKNLGQPKDDYPVLLPEFLDLCDFMCAEYHLRKVDCMHLFVPTQLRNGKAKPLVINFVKARESFDKAKLIAVLRANAVKKRALIEFIEPDKIYSQTELNKKFGNANVNALIESGELILTSSVRFRTPEVIEREDKVVELTGNQSDIVTDILNQRERTHLIFGVTGSGKTEVYMRIIEQVLSENKTAILLVPEISLTPQMLSTFTARFGKEVAILHSGLSDGERFDEWQRLRTGQARIAIGARSAIFAPLKNLGAIIIDEEHDPSYKSESNPRFETHGVAKFRGKYNHCPIILGSATPSLSSFYASTLGEYVLHSLPNRVNLKPMPPIEIVNMCDELRHGNTSIFSGKLLAELTECVKSQHQAMLFLNRRGFSSFMICRECGYVAKCEDCDVSLVYHKEDEQLKCHYCNRRYKALTNCPECGSGYIRQGAIGTERVVEELRKLFPNVEILRMDFDTTKNKNALNNLLKKFAETQPCILVGTQMIAKGHDFPRVTLVGILNADMSLHFSDYRSSERTFQLITQVAGRAGRAENEGKVILQSFTPRHYVYKFAADYDYLGFYRKEINLREITRFPPFAKIVRILVAGENKDEARSVTAEIYNAIHNFYLQNREEFMHCNAMAAPISKLEKKFRFQILARFKIGKAATITDFIYNTVSATKHKKCQVFIEINPTNMS